ncbi:MAG TPA: hypothetical protein VFZ68_05165 [Acidimicrobiales bacterium]
MIFTAVAIITAFGCLVVLGALLVYIEREVNRAEEETRHVTGRPPEPPTSDGRNPPEGAEPVPDGW